MYEIAPKFRYACRWLAAGAAVLVIAAAVFALALPSLIQDRAVRDGLIRSLSAWSGGPVTVHGPLRIVSFTSLSIEANGVSFASAPRLSPIGRVEAKSITALLRIQSLLSGRIEFKKVSIEAPRFVFDRRLPSSKLPFFGLETAGAAVAFADLSRFEQLELSDCAFFTAGGRHRAYSRFHVERVRIDKGRTLSSSPGSADPRNGTPVTFSLRDVGFEAFFHGNLSSAEQTALGAFRLSLSRDHPASRKLAAAIAPWEQADGVSLGGDLIWSGTRASLDRVTAVFGDHRARGSLTVAKRHGRPLLEGTLAYDKLDWMHGGQETAGESSDFMEPLRALAFARAGQERSSTSICGFPRSASKLARMRQARSHSRLPRSLTGLASTSQSWRFLGAKYRAGLTTIPRIPRFSR